MTLLWLVSGASLVAALVAWRQARRNAQRLEQLSQMHWELRYQHGELRARLQQLAASGVDSTTSASAQASGDSQQTSRPEQPTDGFVSLASLKRL